MLYEPDARYFDLNVHASIVAIAIVDYTMTNIQKIILSKIVDSVPMVKSGRVENLLDVLMPSTIE